MRFSDAWVLLDHFAGYWDSQQCVFRVSGLSPMENCC